MKPRCNKKYFSQTSGLLHLFYDRYLTAERMENARRILREREQLRSLGPSSGKAKRKAASLDTFDYLGEFELQRRDKNPFSPVMTPLAICSIEVSMQIR